MENSPKTNLCTLEKFVPCVLGYLCENEDSLRCGSSLTQLGNSLDVCHDLVNKKLTFSGTKDLS